MDSERLQKLKEDLIDVMSACDETADDPAVHRLWVALSDAIPALDALIAPETMTDKERAAMERGRADIAAGRYASDDDMRRVHEAFRHASAVTGLFKSPAVRDPALDWLYHKRG